jgi:lysophospholipase L1-like esterase
MDIIGSIKADLSKGKPLNIVFIGDSITSAEWVHPNFREIIEYVLKEELTSMLGSEKWKIPSWGIRCYNCGFDGSTTKDILDNLGDRILSLKPNIAIYLANTNDIHINKDLSEYKKDVKAIIDALSKKCDIIMLANSIPGNNARYNNSYEPYAKSIKSLKLNSKTIFIDIYSSYKDYDLYRFFTFKSGGNQVLGIAPGEIDFVHPNQLGNAYIAKLILEKGFGIKFDPERFITGTSKGEMYPGY